MVTAWTTEHAEHTEHVDPPSPGPLCSEAPLLLSQELVAWRELHPDTMNVLLTPTLGSALEGQLHAGPGGCLLLPRQGAPGGGDRSLSRATVVLTQCCSPAPQRTL